MNYAPGHNRSNATDDNCPAYFDEKEIKRREDQKRKKELAILREEQRIARLEQDEKNAERLRADFLRQAEELNQAVARTGELRKEEIKKSKQKVQRMQKRQNLT